MASIRGFGAESSLLLAPLTKFGYSKGFQSSPRDPTDVVGVKELRGAEAANHGVALLGGLLPPKRPQWTYPGQPCLG